MYYSKNGGNILEKTTFAKQLFSCFSGIFHPKGVRAQGFLKKKLLYCNEWEMPLFALTTYYLRKVYRPHMLSIKLNERTNPFILPNNPETNLNFVFFWIYFYYNSFSIKFNWCDGFNLNEGWRNKKVISAFLILFVILSTHYKDAYIWTSRRKPAYVQEKSAGTCSSTDVCRPRFTNTPVEHST